MTNLVTWVSRRPRIVLLVWLVIYAVGVFVLPHLMPSFIKPSADWIYLWTGVVVIWYAVETRAMRKEISRQVDAQIQLRQGSAAAESRLPAPLPTP